MSRWDSYADIQASSLTGKPDTFAYEAFTKGPYTYLSWVDFSGEESKTLITAFESGEKLDARALKKPGGLDALFAKPVKHQEITDSNMPQDKLVDALDLKLRGAAAQMDQELMAGRDHGMTTMRAVGKINPGF